MYIANILTYFVRKEKRQIEQTMSFFIQKNETVFFYRECRRFL